MTKLKRNKLLVILGPTATGKTDLALRLVFDLFESLRAPQSLERPEAQTRRASLAQGELISADSRQVYKGLDIGTGKLSGSRRWEVRRGKGYWRVNGIKIWMYDVAGPKKQYTVFNYVKDASRVIREVRDRGKLPIIVGGTGFYLRALLYGLSNLAIPSDKKLRGQLQEFTKEELQEKLKKIAIKRWEAMNFSDRENPRRLVRAIELTMSSLRRQGSNKLTHVRNWILLESERPRSRRPAYAGMTGLNILKVGLTAPRKILYQKVDDRVISRIKQGMIEEAKRLHKSGLTYKRMRQLGLEYGVLADYLGGKISTEDELTRILQNKIHGYVRRQLIWFKKEKDVVWFNITDKDFTHKVENLIARWYHKS